MTLCPCLPCVVSRRVGLIAFSVPIFAMYLVAGFAVGAWVASCECSDAMCRVWNGVSR